MEAAELLDAFQNQKVGDAGGQLDVGCRLDRAAVQVWRDLGVMRLGHAGDFFALQNAAHPAQRRLQNAGGTGFQHPGKLVFGAQPLAGGNRDAGVACHLGHHLGPLWRGGLLKPQRVVLFDAARHALGARHGVLAVGAEQDVGLVTHRFADQLAKALRHVHALQRGLARVKHRIAAHGIKFDRSKPLLHIDCSPFCRANRIAVKGVVLGLVGVQVGVAAQTRVDQAAEQAVDRAVQRLAGDVPAGHLQRAEHAHQRNVRPQREALAVGAAPQGFGLHRVFAGKHPGEQVFGHGRNDVRAEGGGIGFAHALYAAGGADFDEHKVLATKARWWVADDKGLDRFEFHGLTP